MRALTLDGGLSEAQLRVLLTPSPRTLSPCRPLVARSPGLSELWPRQDWVVSSPAEPFPRWKPLPVVSSFVTHLSLPV